VKSKSEFALIFEMKFIEDDKLIQLTQELSNIVYGNRVVNGRVECFSCKRAGGDKKYAHELTEKYLHEIENSDALVQKIYILLFHPIPLKGISPTLTYSHAFEKEDLLLLDLRVIYQYRRSETFMSL